MLRSAVAQYDFPDEPVRDLLGLLRAMYRVESRQPVPARRKLALIEELARELKDADLEARMSAPGSTVYLESCARAEAVAVRLADLVELTDAVEPVLLAAGARVRKANRGGR
jgi:hypothetical protein